MGLNECQKYIKHVFAEKRREILTYYAGIKLQIPAHTKTLTIGELKEAGGSFEGIISISDDAICELKKKAKSRQNSELVLNKVKEALELEKTHVKEYYQKLKQRIPMKLLNKTLAELTEEEKRQLGGS